MSRMRLSSSRRDSLEIVKFYRVESGSRRFLIRTSAPRSARSKRGRHSGGRYRGPASESTLSLASTIDADQRSRWLSNGWASARSATGSGRSASCSTIWDTSLEWRANPVTGRKHGVSNARETALRLSIEENSLRPHGMCSAAGGGTTHECFRDS
jgi:hypothetical protein